MSTPTESETPRVDNETLSGKGMPGRYFVSADFARSIERDLSAVQAERDRLKAELISIKSEEAYVRLQRDALLEITWLDLPDDPDESTARWKELFAQGWERKNLRSDEISYLERKVDELTHELEHVWKPAAAMNEQYARGYEAERDKLKSKVLRQRTELRRLNRRLQAMWEGVRFGHKCRRASSERALQARCAKLEKAVENAKFWFATKYIDSGGDDAKFCHEQLCAALAGKEQA